MALANCVEDGEVVGHGEEVVVGRVPWNAEELDALVLHGLPQLPVDCCAAANKAVNLSRVCRDCKSTSARLVTERGVKSLSRETGE